MGSFYRGDNLRLPNSDVFKLPATLGSGQGIRIPSCTLHIAGVVKVDNLLEALEITVVAVSLDHSCR